MMVITTTCEGLEPQYTSQHWRCGGGDGGGGAVRSVDGDNQVRPKGSLHDRGPKASVKGDSVLDVLGVKGLCTF